MTRMLWNFLLTLAMASMIGGCSLFSGDSESVDADVDTESVSSSEVVLDTEDEMLEESKDLVSSGDDFAEPLGEADPESQESLDDEFAASGIETEEDDAFNDEFDQEVSTSQTDDNQVDQELAQSELDEFGEFDEMEKEGNEFALEEDPVIDEPDPSQPIVDVPQQEMAAASYDNEVTNLQYKAFENGGTVVIETSSPASYKKIVDPALNQIVIQVDGVFLPERFKRPYITKDFKQDIATINAYADDSGAARFVIQLKRPVEPQVVKEGRSILVMTSGGTPMTQAKTEVEDLGPEEQPLNELVAENQMKITSQQVSPNGDMATGAGVPTINNSSLQSVNGKTSQEMKLAQSFGGAEKSGLSLNSTRFSGEKINLEFIDTDIRSIIEVIAERSGVNLIMDKEVDGTTSIKLRDVPWDQALLVLLRSQGLGYVKQGSVLRIAKQSTLSQEAQAVSAQIKSEKQAKLLTGGIKVKYIPVSYAKVSELAKKLKEFLSEKGKIAFDDRTSSLVITDYGEYISRVTELVRALDTAPMQVEIESKLVEAREDFIREAGIEWNIAGQDFPFGSQTGRVSNSFDTVSTPNQGYAFDLTLGSFDIFGDLTAALRIYESQNKIKVLSQPRIVTMNKVKANIEQKTSIPIQVSTINPGAPPQITFEFVDLTLSLDVTPQITFKGDVILDVALKREFAGARSGDGSREINKRAAKSTVMVKNGKTAVLGGIYQQDDGDLETGIPLLKDIPLIGYLFKSFRKEKIKNELLLFLKPKILKEIDGPMVSKVDSKATKYDPFEELSVDEGSNEEGESAPPSALADDIPGDAGDDFEQGLEEDLAEGFEDVLEDSEDVESL